MASTETREDKELSELIDLLNQLQRPLESLAWRGVQLAYGQAVSPSSNEQSQQIVSQIVADRSKVLKENRGKAPRRFILCGVDLDALP